MGESVEHIRLIGVMLNNLPDFITDNMKTFIQCDLPDSKRKVTKSEAENFAKNIGVAFLEVSALTRANVKEAFTAVVHDYLIKSSSNDNKTGRFSCPCF